MPRTGWSNPVVDQALWSQLFLDEMKKECTGWNTTCRQKWSLFLLEQMFHNAAAMQHKEHQRCSWRVPPEPTETALEHPSVWTLIGSRDSDLLWVTEQIYKGEYMVAPSMFTHPQQEDFMKELWRDLSGCMTRAGLWSNREPAELPSRSQRSSWCLDEEDQALEVEQQKDDPGQVDEPVLGEWVDQGSIKAPFMPKLVPVPLSYPSMIPSCWQAAPLLHEESQVTT